jgi:tellurite methyltransferase
MGREVVGDLGGRINPVQVQLNETVDVPSYWSAFYSEATAPAEPSAFARSVAERWPDLPVIDIGCGNGRDSLFFITQGRKVAGLDSCPEAVALCGRQAERLGGLAPDQARFVAGSATDRQSWDAISGADSGPVLIYARFLFHAVPDEAEAAILDLAGEVLARRGGALCAEFRTPRDEALAKVMPEHYRRFVDPDAFCARLDARGLRVVERHEGQGLAVYKGEDAYVARVHACP